MKHYHYFEDEINTDNINNLIDNLCAKDTKVLYFSTPGGFIDAMDVLVNFLNDNEIEIVLTENVSSCGVMILTDYQGKIKVSSELEYILFHAWDRKQYSIRKQDISQKQLNRMIAEDNERCYAKYMTLGLTEKDIEKMKKGKDVIYYRKDFDKLGL